MAQSRRNDNRGCRAFLRRGCHNVWNLLFRNRDGHQIGSFNKVQNRIDRTKSVDLRVMRVDEVELPLKASGPEIFQDGVPRRGDARTRADDRNRARRNSWSSRYVDIAFAQLCGKRNALSNLTRLETVRNLGNPAVAHFHIAAFDRGPRYTVRDLLLMGIAGVSGEGVIESFTIDILGVRRQMTLYGRWKASLYSVRHDFRSGIRGLTDITSVAGLCSFH
jgi:hypothetical protein